MPQRAEARAGGGECLKETHYPCEDLTHGKEFVRIEVPKDHADRLKIENPPVLLSPDAGRALRAEVRDGDQAWNPDANDGQGALIEGGWRAEAQGETETQRETPVRYDWATLLPEGYPVDPQGPDSPGDPPWQVIFQWHQSDTDRGGPPPVGFTVKWGNICLDLNTWDPDNEKASIHIGTWVVGPAKTGVWHRFRAEIIWHLDKGSVKVWHNDEVVTFGDPLTAGPAVGEVSADRPPDALTGLPTLFPAKPLEQGEAPLPAPSVYLKVGLYREAVSTNPPGPYVLYHDEIHRCVLNPQNTSKWWQNIKLPKWVQDLIDRLRR